MDSNRTTLSALLSLGVVLALSACASVPGSVSYPVSWAPIDPGVAADGCPRLEGTYSNRGIGTFPPELGEPPSLGNIFARLGPGTGPISASANGRVSPVLSDAISVSIVQTSEILKVTFFSENGEQTSLDFRRYRFNLSEERYDDLFTCYRELSFLSGKVRFLAKEPRLRFMAEPKSPATGIAPIYFKGFGTLVFLLKAEDDSLIVQWRGDISEKSVWWRYPLLRGVQ